MEGYKFKESEILNIRVDKSFGNIEDLENNKNIVDSELTLELDLEGFNKYISNNKVLSEEIDTLYFFEDIEKNMEDVFILNHTLNLKINKKVENDVSRETIMSIINEINDLIQQEFNEKLGKNLELYINRKEEEAHYEKLIDFENSIAKRVRDRFRQDFKEMPYIFYGHKEMPFRFDTRNQIMNSDGSLATTNGNFGLGRIRNKEQKDELIKKLESSEFVTNCYFNGTHRDVINIEVTESAKQIFNQVAKEETEKFYKEPAFPNVEVGKYDQFVEKNSNQKGGVMDVYFNEYKREVVVVEGENSRKIGLNEETSDKTLKEAIDIVDRHLQEKIKQEKIKSLSAKRMKR